MQPSITLGTVLNGSRHSQHLGIVKQGVELELAQVLKHRLADFLVAPVQHHRGKRPSL
ncbi:hypothetical protein D3C80_1888200 [compost metagenome]